MRDIDRHTKLSALWLFILLNTIFRDLHEFAKKDVLEMFLTGTYNGVEITETLLLVGGLLSLVPISMVLFSLLLERRWLRPATFAAAFIQTATMLSAAPGDLDDSLHLVVGFFAMASIVWTAWAWQSRGMADRLEHVEGGAGHD